MSTKKIALVLMCVFAMTVIPVVEADAWWKGVGEMSGPGPFFGFDFIFPWSLSNPDLDLVTVSVNRALLNDIIRSDDPIPPLKLTGLEFIKDEQHAQFYGEVLDIEVLKSWDASLGRDALIETFLTISFDFPLARSYALPETRQGVTALSDDQQTAAVEMLFRILDDRVWDKKSEELSAKTRNYGIGWAGFFGSQTAFPKLLNPAQEEKNEFNNWFFTLATGYAFSIRNKLDFPDGNDDSTRVHWLTVYPAFEYRFGIDQPDPNKAYVKSNWFLNFGPTFHYFSGEAFDNFTRVSARTRAGWRYKAVYFGAELDYFVPIFPHSEFGATPDGEIVRFSYGAFIGFEIRRFLAGKRDSARAR